MEHSKWLERAAEEATKSPDTSRKTGCVIVLHPSAEFNGTRIIPGHNTFPHGVFITPARLERPHKYTFTEHAERNAIYEAARNGISLFGSSIFLPWFPCADCARAIVQSGIRQLVGYEPDWTEERYGFRDAETILKEGGVEIVYADRA
jgi:dCMP deaminase